MLIFRKYKYIYFLFENHKKFKHIYFHIVVFKKKCSSDQI